MTSIQFAKVTSVGNDKINVQFNQDESPSGIDYLKLKSYEPTVGDKVAMLRTNTSFLCIGAIG